MISVLASFATLGFTIYYGQVTQDRQAKLERIARFDASNVQVLEAGGAFIAAVNAAGDLGGARQKFRVVLAQQLQDADGLRSAFGSTIGREVSAFRQAISDLNTAVQRVSSPEEMRIWTESFGKVLDIRSSLSRELYEALGVLPS